MKGREDSRWGNSVSEQYMLITLLLNKITEIVFIEVLPQLFHRRLRAINKSLSWVGLCGRWSKLFVFLWISFLQNLCQVDETNESAATPNTGNNGDIKRKYDGTTRLGRHW